MDFSAVFHRASDNFCYAVNKEELIINLKTGYDVERVFLYYGDPFEGGILGGDFEWIPQEEEIFYKKRLKYQLWWTITVKPEYKRCKYYFKLQTKEESYYYFEDGFYLEEEMNQEGKLYNCFTFPWMNPADLNETPAWVNDTVWYQIFPDRFCNGNPNNNPQGVKPWQCGPVSNYEYYGGDLRGIIDRLDYLKELGINGIYMTPVFEADSVHKYNTKDYTKIDPAFGSAADLKELVEKAHGRGMRIMLDGVFNHCGRNFMPWEQVVEQGPNSPYYNWFMVHKWPFSKEGGGPRKGEYDSFAFAGNMPKLNTNEDAVISYFCDIVKDWIADYDIDGIRLDVANELSHKFCKELRKTVKSSKPDFYILGEIWHDSIHWLRGDEFDAVMNYPLSAGISDFWLYEKRSKEDFEYAVNHYYTMYMQQTNDVLFNLLDSHDTNRLINKAKDADIFYQQLAVLYTMPGSPCIYYGTEIRMEGGHDPDCRRCMPWEAIERGDYEEAIGNLRQLIAVRKREPALKSRNFHFPNEISNERVIEYIKIENGTRIKVLLNCSSREEEIGKIEEEAILYKRNFKDGILERKGVLIYRL